MRTIIEPDCPDCHGRGEIFDTEQHGRECWMISYTCPCVRYEHSAHDLAVLKSILGADKGGES